MAFRFIAGYTRKLQRKAYEAPSAYASGDDSAESRRRYNNRGVCRRRSSYCISSRIRSCQASSTVSSANLASYKLLGVAPFEFGAVPCVDGRLVNSRYIIFNTEEINIDCNNVHGSRCFQLWHKIAFQIIVRLINLLINAYIIFNYYVTQT